MASILIIDDDRAFCDAFSRRIHRMGHSAVFALTLKDGVGLAKAHEFDVIMLDVGLPDGDGIQSVPVIKKMHYDPEIIIITGAGDPDGAELAIRWGAWDYIEKPASVNAITLPLSRALAYRKEKKGGDFPPDLNRDGIIGNSHRLRSCLNLVSKAASSDVSVLIQGETGVGKELLARAIHRNSPRAKEPFIVVDCAAIPESLVEGILLGYEKGAFTGADHKQIGLVEQAHKGTLFLDEVGELPSSIQKAFLRVLQEHRYRPLGSKIEVSSDFRLISATNRKLETMVKTDAFRKDLLYRIYSFSIPVPPLRERPEDILELAMYHISEKCRKTGILTKGFSPDFFEAIGNYHWPGNVRELFNALESAMATAGEEPVLFPNHLPDQIRIKIARSSIGKTAKGGSGPIPVTAESLQTSQVPETYRDFRNRLLETGEKKYFAVICDLAKGNVNEACRLAGLSKSRLYFFLQKHGISLADFKYDEAQE